MVCVSHPIALFFRNPFEQFIHVSLPYFRLERFAQVVVMIPFRPQRFASEKLSVFPVPIRNNGKRGQYRKEMKNYFDHAQYWQRNCAEYNNSSLKRRFGDYVRSVNFSAQHAEVTARIIIHNLKYFLTRLFHQSLKHRKIYIQPSP